MNKLQTNALRIAELMGYEQSKAEHVLIRHRVGHNKNEILDVFSSYDGLMPIMFEIYASQHFTINIYNWVGRCILLAHNSNTTPNWGQEPLNGNYRYDFDRDITENEFIEGLQTVIIKYLEQKNGK